MSDVTSQLGYKLCFFTITQSFGLCDFVLAALEADSQNLETILDGLTFAFATHCFASISNHCR